MFNKHKILAVIPARGGSKGIPNKNIQKIAGRSLVEWALFTAMASPIIDRIVVSSDSKRIINQANRHGEFAPFVRPEELARDDTPSLPVFEHALKMVECEDKCRYDYIVVLEPPCPFRLPKHIREGVKLAISAHASSVMSLVRVSDGHPVRIKKLLSNGQVQPFCIPEPEGLRRQDQEPAFIRNSAIYVFARKTIIGNRLWGDAPYGFEMERNFYNINIDEPLDIVKAIHFYKKLKKEDNLHFIDAALGCAH
jgi:CMP-N-acetylneuraminic acid synthetase